MAERRDTTSPPVTDVEVLARERVFQGYFAVDRYRLRHRLHRGGMGPEVTREVFERGHAVGVLPVDSQRRRVVLIRQFRPGALAAGWPTFWLREVVAGIIEEGEAPEQVARRELQEETGLACGGLSPLARYLVSPGGTSESVYLFRAEVDAANLTPFHGKAEENEDIALELHDFDAVPRLLDQPESCNAVTLLALMRFMLQLRQPTRATSGG